jgi:hypothetical protein
MIQVRPPPYPWGMANHAFQDEHILILAIGHRREIYNRHKAPGRGHVGNRLGAKAVLRPRGYYLPFSLGSTWSSEGIKKRPQGRPVLTFVSPDTGVRWNIYMRRGQSPAMKDQPERDMVNWGGREGESTSVRRRSSYQKGLCVPAYALFGRNYDRRELTNVYFSRIA